MSIGFVTLVQGEVLARDPQGNTRRLKEGDQINKGETIITSAGSRVEIMTDNGPIALGEQQTVAMTDEVAGTVDAAEAVCQSSSTCLMCELISTSSLLTSKQM